MNLFLMMQPGAEGGGTSGILIWVMIIVIFYFFMIRPQMKKAKELKKFRENLKVGDKVVTVGGIHGKIKELGETTVVIDTGSAPLRIEKSALSSTGQADLAQQKK